MSKFDRPCKDYSTARGCKFGNRCHYIHSNNAPAPKAKPPTARGFPPQSRSGGRGDAIDVPLNDPKYQKLNEVVSNIKGSTSVYQKAPPVSKTQMFRDEKRDKYERIDQRRDQYDPTRMDPTNAYHPAAQRRRDPLPPARDEFAAPSRHNESYLSRTDVYAPTGRADSPPRKNSYHAPVSFRSDYSPPTARQQRKDKYLPPTRTDSYLPPERADTYRAPPRGDYYAPLRDEYVPADYGTPTRDEYPMPAAVLHRQSRPLTPDYYLDKSHSGVYDARAPNDDFYQSAPASLDPYAKSSGYKSSSYRERSPPPPPRDDSHRSTSRRRDDSFDRRDWRSPPPRSGHVSQSRGRAGRYGSPVPFVRRERIPPPRRDRSPHQRRDRTPPRRGRTPPPRRERIPPPQRDHSYKFEESANSRGYAGYRDYPAPSERDRSPVGGYRDEHPPARNRSPYTDAPAQRPAVESKWDIKAPEADDGREGSRDVCVYYNSIRGCDKGRDCPFQHIVGVSGSKPMRQQEECKWYNGRSGCKRQDCKFAHIDKQPGDQRGPPIHERPPADRRSQIGSGKRPVGDDRRPAVGDRRSMGGDRLLVEGKRPPMQGRPQRSNNRLCKYFTSPRGCIHPICNFLHEKLTDAALGEERAAADAVPSPVIDNTVIGEVWVNVAGKWVCKKKGAPDTADASAATTSSVATSTTATASGAATSTAGSKGITAKGKK